MIILLFYNLQIRNEEVRNQVQVQVILTRGEQSKCVGPISSVTEAGFHNKTGSVFKYPDETWVEWTDRNVIVVLDDKEEIEREKTWMEQELR